MKLLRALFWPPVFAPILAVYIAALMLPATWWYEPREVLVAQVKPGDPVMVVADRIIHRAFAGSYTADVRRFPGDMFACGKGGAHQYKTGLPTPTEPYTLADWAGGDPRCDRLPDGVYTLETCWTVLAPFGFLPPKTVCITSNPFRIVREVQP